VLVQLLCGGYYVLAMGVAYLRNSDRPLAMLAASPKTMIHKYSWLFYGVSSLFADLSRRLSPKIPGIHKMEKSMITTFHPLAKLCTLGPLQCIES